MSGNLIEEYIDEKSLDAMSTLLVTEDEKETLKSAILVSEAFGASKSFKEVATNENDSEAKLLSSFHKNLELLIQKTWIEKSDEELKEKVLFNLEQFNKNFESKKYSEAYKLFFSIVSDVVYLMFGNQTKTAEFSEYALRIDPEFGIFWWYIQCLPRDTSWSEPKSRITVLLGMYFLANY